MLYNLLSGLVVIIHLLFIMFVTLGVLFVLKWPKLVWFHIPMVIWGILVEYFNIICPLTPLENYFKRMAGGNTYETDFIEQYIIPVIYPEVLTRNLQFILGTILLVINLGVYGYILYRKVNKQTSHK